MQLVNTESKADFYADLIKAFNQKLPAKQAAALQQFARHYFDHIPLEEFRGVRFSDLYGSILCNWQFIQQFDAATPKVQVLNPNLEEHGWQSTHTAILVLELNAPFVVDSLRMALNRLELTIHAMQYTPFFTARDAKHRLKRFAVRPDDAKPQTLETFIYIEVDRRNQSDQLDTLQREVSKVLREVRTVVSDYEPMKNHLKQIIDGLQQSPAPTGSGEQTESVDFLNWLLKDHFTFLGYDEYQLVGEGNEATIEKVSGSQLGILKSQVERPAKLKFDELPMRTRLHLQQHRLLTFAKSASRSRIHRPAYPEYISIKQFDEQGNPVGERRFLGLYTAQAYDESPRDIPILRHKVAEVMQKAGIFEPSTKARELDQIFRVYPRDELFQLNDDELFDVALATLSLQERRKIKLFMHEDVYGQFVSCLVYVPRDLYSTDLRQKIGEILEQATDALDSEFTTYLSESVLARTQFILRVPPVENRVLDVAETEAKIIQAATSWEDGFRESLHEIYGEEQASEYFHLYENAFTASYQEAFSPRLAVLDIEHMQEVADTQPVSISFYRALEEDSSCLHLKLFNLDNQMTLSDVIPVIENLGLKVIGEHPFVSRDRSGKRVWVHDFSLESHSGEAIDLHKVKDIFHDLFMRVLDGEAENDGFNRLLLSAYLDWREIAMLRGLARYMQQIRFSNSQTFIAATLVNHAAIARQIVHWFVTKFDPAYRKSEKQRRAELEKLEQEFYRALDGVSNLSEDRVLNRFADLIKATLRTNYFQPDAEGRAKNYIAYKMAPKRIPDMPLPLPMFEIFVYSPQVEGVHLRGGKVARGGLRWSDRYEDFRTEVLGLVKAQQVKNAVIVPVGAKGGFVAKRVPEMQEREQMQAEGIACYKTFISGLLDVTDNIVEGGIAPPAAVVRQDEDDPYLVVAADKGTATFSDIANGIAQERGFWMGDAFASGGSQGYDHKKMGITARGAWVSVERHFRELGVNTAQESFSVLGIGDMSGDVFGNGMLLSKHIALVAAFNHMHIFIDPTPDTAKSYKERKRLFDLPRSSWEDYDQKLISAGGGIFSRAAKSIPLSAEMKKLLNSKAESMAPNQLLSHLLRARVDLIWFGGIGTYVKASDETHADVGDKANDALRVDARQLNCKVIGEGGNLGMTQRARIEAGLHGVALNTDFIDNAGGVDCSDHEVNIKILLNDIVSQGDMTEKQRNQLLADMTDEVADLVLTNNYRQTQALAIAHRESATRIEEYRRLMNTMEAAGKLNRELEYLPSDDAMVERKTQSKGLTRPELSVLISYVKGELKASLIGSDIHDDAELCKELTTAFPARLNDTFGEALFGHQLRREIVSTQIANDMVNHMGITFVDRLQRSTGATHSAIARAYIIARNVFNLPTLWRRIEKLDYKVASDKQLQMMTELITLTRRASRWILRNRRAELNVAENMDKFARGVAQISRNLATLLQGAPLENWKARYKALTKDGVPEQVCTTVAGAYYLYSALGIIEAQEITQAPLTEVATTYFTLGRSLELQWFAEQINQLRVTSHWEALARESFREDLDWQQRALTVGILQMKNKPKDAEEAIDVWKSHHQELVARWQSTITELKATKHQEPAMYSVALREILDLAQTTTHREIVC